MANPYFNAAYYLAQNPDVFAAGINTTEGAWEHYVNFGAAEALNGAASRKPAPWFDVEFYLNDNPDLLTAGLSAGQLFEHFTNYGIEEGREPNAADNVDAATMSAYAVANPDVAEALGVEDPANPTEAEVNALAQHFYAFGYAEGRPGLPYDPSDLDPDPNVGQTFTLTNAVGENVVGTAGNDTFKAVQGDATGLVATSTLNIGDVINGGAGTDTLELILAGAAAGAFPAGASVQNVEIVNLVHTDDAAFTGALGVTAQTTSTNYAGIQQLWQVDNDNTAGTGTFDAVVVGAGVTAGFRSTGATATAEGVLATAAVTAATTTQTSLVAALDGVAHNSTLTFSGAGVKTIEVSGSVAAQAAGNAGDLNIANAAGAGATIAETIKVSTTSAVDLIIDQTGGANSFGATVKTIDASAATGAIRANATDGAAIDNTVLTGLTSVKLGSGADNVAFTFGGTKALAIDAGAGADRIDLGGVVAAGNDVTVTLGEGKDVLAVNNSLQTMVAGVATPEEVVDNMVVITDFKTAEDVLDLSGAGGVALSSEQLTTIASAADIRAAVIAVDTIVGAGSAVFNYDGNAYVFSSSGAGLAATDALVQLVGVDATEFTNIQNGNLVL